jgi:hypothetical protein
VGKVRDSERKMIEKAKRTDCRVNTSFNVGRGFGGG